MLDDVTYLKLFVSPKVDWEAIIKKTYSRREINKAELKKRVAFTVVSGLRGLVQEFKEPMFLERSDAISQYHDGDWEAMFNEIKRFDDDIAKTRKELKKIKYLAPGLVPHDSMTYWAYSFLISEWGLTAEQASEEVSLYGSRTIERFGETTGGKYYKHRGRYHFVRTLHEWAGTMNIPLIAYKRDELNNTMFEI